MRLLAFAIAGSLGGALVASCTATIHPDENEGPTGTGGQVTSLPDASGPTGTGGSTSGGGSSKPDAQPEIVWQASVGTWCGPADDKTLWLVAGPEARGCEASASGIFNAEGELASDDGFVVELPTQELAALPATLNLPVRHCAAGSCETLDAEITIDSYAEGQALEGSWSFSVGGEAKHGSLSTAWCDFNQHLPAHPEGERLARGLTLAEVAVYQAVKIPIVEDAQEVLSRNADVIAGRPALVRVFVEPAADFQPREIAARLTIENAGAEPQVLEISQMIASGSTDADLTSTFNFELPADALTPDSEYSVELRETSACQELMGEPNAARFPVSGLSAMNARTTGPMKVKLVPVISTSNGSHEPDTSDELVQAFADELMRMYPTTEVITSVGEPFYTAIDIGVGFDTWDDLLDDLRSLKQQEGAPSDLHYYGLLNPDGARGAGGLAGAGYGRDGPTAGAGVGLGRSPNNAGIFAHEVGHMNGRPHSPCGGADGVDNEYPYFDGNIGVWGYDILSKELKDPEDGWKDLLSYCDPAWVSDYNYRFFTDRIALLNGVSPSLNWEPQTFWSLRVDDNGGAQWGREVLWRTPPGGIPEVADVLGADGGVLKSVRVYRTEFDHYAGFIVDVPAPRPGWAAIRVRGLSAPQSFANPPKPL